MASIFITGAAGVGKTTLSREFMQNGFTPSPNHLSRLPRADEVDGVDAQFISRTQFEQNFDSGMYLEDSLEEAEYLGIYYGSPRDWISHALGVQETVSVPANVMVLDKMLSSLPEFHRSGLVWVNLFASTSLRRDRLSERITDPAVLEGRLYSGVSQGEQPSADLNIDTGTYTPDQAFAIVTQCLKNKCS